MNHDAAGQRAALDASEVALDVAVRAVGAVVDRDMEVERARRRQRDEPGAARAIVTRDLPGLPD